MVQDLWDDIKDGMDSKRAEKTADKEPEKVAEDKTPDTKADKAKEPTEKPEEKADVVSSKPKVAEEPNEEIKDKKPEEPTEGEVFLKQVNEALEGEYKDIDEIKNSLSSLNELKDVKEEAERLREENKRIEALEKELEAKHDELNPEKIYKGVEGYKNHLIAEKAKAEKYPDSVISKIVGLDLTKVDDMSIIMMDIERQAPSLGVDSLRTEALSQIGLNLDQVKDKMKAEAEEKGESFVFNMNNVKLTETQIGKMQFKAAQLRDKFNTLKQVDIPEYKGYKETKEQKMADVEKQRTELMDKWGDKQKTLAKEFKIEFKVTNDKGEDDSYEFVDEAFNKQIPDLINKEIVSGNIEPTDKNIKGLMQRIKDAYWSSSVNRQKVLNKMIEDARTKEETKQDDKVHNAKPINKDTAPPKEKTAAKGELRSFLNVDTNLDSIFK